MRKKIIAANWKMHGNFQWIQQYGRILTECANDISGHCILFPPFPYIHFVSQLLSGLGYTIGAQNCSTVSEGAYTGEVSALMLKEVGCQYILVGHSERRRLFSENEKIVAEKFHHAKEHGMIPVLCVGETLEEREKGLTETVLIRQIQAVAEHLSGAFEQCVIAYEPVWAIGTGLTASPEQAQETHSVIRNHLVDLKVPNANEISILYGGSVNEHNAGELFAMPDVDGGLVGGASLDAHKFLGIVECIKSL